MSQLFYLAFIAGKKGFFLKMASLQKIFNYVLIFFIAYFVVQSYAKKTILPNFDPNVFFLPF